eukprot:GHVU01069943.1.p1 GENE.GHVU01069943.1~~GHVU01069943.1.p1  ORF type:complete len:234 (-),score=38.10 GHVU01069943.1:500-1201(-)
MKSRTIAILLLAVGASCHQFIKGEAAAAADFEAELDARTSEKAAVKEEDAGAASILPRSPMHVVSWALPGSPKPLVPTLDSDEEDSSPSGEERMMFEVEEANAEECELGESADKRSTKATTCQADNLRRARELAYYRAPPAAYYPRRPAYAPDDPYFPRRMEEDGHEYRGPPRGSSPRPSLAPTLRREGNDWVVLFPKMVKHGDHHDVVYNKVTIFKVYDHYLRKYTYTCGGQ